MRYFIVTYSFFHSNMWQHGDLSAKASNGYIIRANLKEMVRKSFNYEIDDIYITNIIELSENDYKDWNLTTKP